MTLLVVMENADPDRHGIDVSLMFVPDDYNTDEVLENSGLAQPIIVEDFPVESMALERFGDNIGQYRPFVG